MTVSWLVAMRGLSDVKSLICLPSVYFWCVKLSFSRIMLHFAKYGQSLPPYSSTFLGGRPCPLLGLMLDKPRPQRACTATSSFGYLYTRTTVRDSYYSPDVIANIAEKVLHRQRVATVKWPSILPKSWSKSINSYRK